MMFILIIIEGRGRAAIIVDTKYANIPSFTAIWVTALSKHIIICISNARHCTAKKSRLINDKGAVMIFMI